MSKSKKSKILLNVKAYIEGECFLCREKTEDEAYCHYECAIAFGEDKQNRIKKADEHNN